MKQNENMKAHGAMLLAMVLFGLMATFSKDVLANGGITGPQLRLQDLRCGNPLLDGVADCAAAARRAP